MCPPDDFKRGKENTIPRINLNLKNCQLNDTPVRMTSNCPQSKASDSSSMRSAHLNRQSDNAHRMSGCIKKEKGGTICYSLDRFNNNNDNTEPNSSNSSPKQRRNNSAQLHRATISNRNNSFDCGNQVLGERSLTLTGPMLRRSCTTMCPDSLNRTRGTRKVPLYAPSKETTMVKDNKGNYVRFRLASKNSCGKSTSSESNCASASSFPHITEGEHHTQAQIKPMKSVEIQSSPKRTITNSNSLDKRKRNFRCRERISQQDFIEKKNKTKNSHISPRPKVLSSSSSPTHLTHKQTRRDGTKLSKSSKDSLAQTLDCVSVQDTNGDCCETEHEEMLDPDQMNRIMNWIQDCERALGEHEETAIVVHHLPAIGE